MIDFEKQMVIKLKEDIRKKHDIRSNANKLVCNDSDRMEDGSHNRTSIWTILAEGSGVIRVA